MKKIINGRRYDTDTAKAVGSDSNGLGVRDFGNWQEILYRKTTGEFFLYGHGGPASKYAAPCGHGWTSGERIIPYTLEEAKEWAEEHLTGDEYEGIFGEVEEDGGKKVVTFSLPLATIDKIKKNAAGLGMSMSDYVAEAISKA